MSLVRRRLPGRSHTKNLSRLRAANTTPAGIIRAKGILNLGENPDRQHIFQLVGKRWSIEAARTWGEAQPGSRLVMIGVPGSIDSAWLEQMISQAYHKVQKLPTQPHPGE